MTHQKLIIICADAYKELATALARQLKELKGVEALAQTVIEYSALETKPSTDTYLLFIGDGEENPYTAFYYPKIAFHLMNECGAHFGGDNTRGIIFGDGDISHRKQLKIIFDKMEKGDIEQTTPDAKKGPNFMRYALIYYMATFSLILPILTASGIFLFRKAQKKKIRYLQVLLGMDRFIETLTNK